MGRGRKTTGSKRSSGLFLLVAIVLLGALTVTRATQAGDFRTVDTLSYQDLADDISHLRPPSLEGYSEGSKPVNPWPMAYAAFLAVVGLVSGQSGNETQVWIGQGLLIIGLAWAAWRLAPSGVVVLVLFIDTCTFLLSHGWSENLFILGMLLAAVGTQRNSRWGFGLGTLLALHSRQMALPAVLAGWFGTEKRRRWVPPLLGSLVTILVFYVFNALYTGQLFGAPRPAVEKDWGHWLSATAHAVLNEACLLRNNLPWYGVLPQLFLFAFLAWKGRPKTSAGRFLVLGGLGYAVCTIALHARIAFAEDLDIRLIGPGTILIVAGLLVDISIERQWVWAGLLLLALIALPWKWLLHQDEVSSDRTHPYPLQLPTWAPPMPIPVRNPLTTEGVALGRALFHDKRLSGNGQISCASCHRPGMAFAERGVAREGLRNTPSLLNVAWQKALFWDGGVSNLESVSLAPLHNVLEMGGRIEKVRTLVQTDPHYRRLVKAAFQADSAQTIHILWALAQYQRTLLSTGNRDEAKRLSNLELQGKSMYLQACESCHPAPFYTDFGYHRILSPPSDTALRSDDPRNGRARITHDPADRFAFKTPSLRNVAETPPYFHDGSAKRLDACLNHGTISIVHISRRQGLDTNQVRTALLAYLRSLTDSIP